MLGLDEARADVLGGAGDAGVGGVEVELARVGEIAGHDRALEEVDVVEAVDQAGDVVEVGERRLAIVAVCGLDHVHRRTRGAEMDLRVPGLEVVPRIGAMEHEAPPRPRQDVLDQGARQAQPAVAAEHRAGRGHQLDAGGDRIGEADLLQHVERRAVDPLHLGVAQSAR